MPAEHSPDAPDPDEHGGAPPHRHGLEVRGPAAGLLDEPLLLRARGAGPQEALVWRARYHDDDGRVWRATAARPEDLDARWVPAKESTGQLAALQSLRPVRVDVRVEAPDGRAASRAVTRRMVADGVQLRRWRDGLTGTLHLPADEAPAATLLVDATAGPEQAGVAALAAPLLASRGVLVLTVAPGRGRATAADLLATARERLAAVPAAAADVQVLPALDPLAPAAGSEPGAAVVLPPGVGARDEDEGAAAARAVAWDALLARLGARPRELR
jgi:hypothetical protein